MSKSIVIYGGGLAGAQLAHILKDEAEITVVSPIDYFEVPMAMPRAMVEPSFTKNSVVSLSASQPEVRHIHGRLVSFDSEGGSVETASGETLRLSADVSVLATGSSYANSLTRVQSGARADRQTEFDAFNAKLKNANRILIVGGGPIGVELAGEITEDYPDKSVTVVESNDSLLKGTSRKVAAHAQKVLEGRGVAFHMGQRIVEPAYGVEPEGGKARTNTGQEIDYDLIFWAVGSRPNTDYLSTDQLTADKRIPMDEHMRVQGMENVFAIGDITAYDEVKKAIYVIDHLKVVTKNIRAALKGEALKATYKAQTGNDIMLVTLGRNGGVAHFPVLGMVKANWLIRLIKGKGMLASMYIKKIGAIPTHEDPKP